MADEKPEIVKLPEPTPTRFVDPDAEFTRLLHELSNAIKRTTGREATITIWPKGVPQDAVQPAIVGTYAGMRVVAPHDAVARVLGRMPR